jgi:hypothetical protein
MTAFVRVSGPPNSNFLVGYPGISATLVSIDLKRRFWGALQHDSLRDEPLASNRRES